MWIWIRTAVLFTALLGGGFAVTDSAQAAERNKSKSVSQESKSASVARNGKSSQAVRNKRASKVSVSAESQWQETRELAVKSSAALVIEQGGGDALFVKNASEVVPIASITKLMTAMVVLDSQPSLRGHITITDEDVDTLRGSRSRLRVGSGLTRESALLLALMSSENRAANALARHYPGGMSAFLTEMNIKAKVLGMKDTHFDDPTGLTSSNVSTAQDLAKMVVAAYRYPLIREFTTTGEAKVDVNGREMAYRNTNPLVRSDAWDVGLSKTGYIHEAGKCLVMQARVADKPVVIVLLDSAGKQTRVGDANRIKRWMETTQASHRVSTHAALSPSNVGPPG